MSLQVHQERITETAVGELFGESVAATTGRIGEYQLPNGQKASGATMLLCFLAGDENIRVGRGSQVDAGGRIWTITRVHLADGGQGWVELETERAQDIALVNPVQLDFLFEEDCDACGGRAGWDGTTDMRMGKLAIGLQCTECPTKMWMTDGRIQRAFFEGPPAFTAGRKR